jgi:hypothetical protein
MKSKKSKSKKSKSKSRNIRGKSLSKTRSLKNVRTKSKCKELLQKKVKKNMQEYKKGRYVSRQQALAVSYSQVKKASPYCNRYFKRTSSKKK